MSDNRKPFLDMIAFSEIGPRLLAVSDNGYNVLVGSTPDHPLLFDSYADHPRIYNKALNSTAAGRYQLLARWYDPYKKLLGLSGFTPEEQDEIALQQIKECHAIPEIDAGFFTLAVAHCSHIWASLPGANYGQHENDMEKLKAAYVAAGGTVASHD